MAKLSKEHWLVAFFLSKYGNTIEGNETTPPVELNTVSWKVSYQYFYRYFGEGRTLQTFENSLKNCRDTFDGHINSSGRKGWRNGDKSPVSLPLEAKGVFSKYSLVHREIIWREIQNIISKRQNETSKSNSLNITKRRTNPDWTRQELILALNLYFDLDQGQMHKNNPDVVRVSNELRELNVHPEIPDIEKFRNPSGVSRRLGNFKTMDSGYDGEGLANSGKLAKEIFTEFKNHRDKLRKEADLIKELYLKSKEKSNTIVADTKLKYSAEFLFQIHKNRELNPMVMREKREAVLSISESLKCEVCGFDSVSFYGELGNDLMEIHYNKELKTEPGLESSNMKDFIIVCSNCHRALDKNYGLLDATDLKKIIRKKIR